MSEVKRVFNYKKIIMLAVFMCINLFLFMYINVPKSANGQSERVLIDTINTLSHIMMRLIQ